VCFRRICLDDGENNIACASLMLNLASILYDVRRPRHFDFVEIVSFSYKGRGQ